MRYIHYLWYILPTVFFMVYGSVITCQDLSDKELNICRDLGYIANSGLTTIKFTEISQNLLELIINCSITPDIWCRLQFSGDCFCVPHNNSDFSENANCTQFSNHSFSGNSISLHVNRSEFHKTFAGSFIGCAANENIHRAFHIAAAYAKTKIDSSDNSKTRQAAVNTIIICLTTILVCIGPCFVLTIISKWRQEQLRQKTMEDERECDNRPFQVKLYGGNSKLNLFGGQRAASIESQSMLLSLKNFTRSTSSSAGSIYSLSGEFYFKQEKIASGRFADCWKGVYTGPLPCGSDKNLVCIKLSKGGINEKALLAEAEFLKQIPPNDHIINCFPIYLSKGDGMVSIFELAMYGDLHTFLCAKNKMMVTQANEYWSKLDSIDGSVQMCAYVTPTPPKLNFNIPELLDIYVTSEPFTGLLSQPLSELDFTVFAHQIAMGLQHLSSHKILHKRLTSESVVIFENFVLKVANFSNNDISGQTDKLSIAPAIQRNKNIERTPSGRPIIKWQAPEVMKNESYSSESDVWSYGMTLWEIISYGETPFDDVVIRLLLKAIEENHYPLRPENCSEELYSLMKSCWKPKSERLSYDIILQHIHDYLILQHKTTPKRTKVTNNAGILSDDSFYTETEV